MTSTTTAEQVRRTSPWVFAVVLNGVVLVVFVTCDDLRTSRYSLAAREARPQKPPAPAAKAKRLDPKEADEVADRLEEKHKAELVTKIERLRDIEHNLEEHKQSRLDELKKRDEKTAKERATRERWQEQKRLERERLAHAQPDAGLSEQHDGIEPEPEQREPTPEELRAIAVSARELKESFQQLSLEQLKKAVAAQAEALAQRAEALEQQDQSEQSRSLKDDARKLKELSERGDDTQSRAQLAQQARQYAKRAEQYKTSTPSSASSELDTAAKSLADLAESVGRQEHEAAFRGQSAKKPALGNIDAAALASRSPAELYELAAQMEKNIVAEFSDARAAEIALIQDKSFREALVSIFVDDPKRPALGGALKRSGFASDEQLRGYNKVLEQAMAQVENMRLAAEAMHAQAQGLTRKGSGGAELSGAELSRAFQSMARGQNAQGRLVDLSAAMRAMWSGGGPGGSSMAYGANANLLPGGAEMGLGIRAGNLDLPQEKIIAQALPGRKFSKDSKRKGWLYLNTWYTIGPFENHGRIDFSKQNAPETIVDLDASYLGKGGKQVRWQFLQSDILRITPYDEQSDSTYYAYTEVHFDEPTDMLLAYATDDAAKIWINDLAVWQDDGLSSWRLDEGFRKVHFKKGFNKLMVRIENGPVVCQFSVLLCPVDPK